MNKFIGKFVIIRTRNAGVHMGYLAEFATSPSGACVVITESRRLWSWTGANTLNEISLRGCGDDSRISEPVEYIALTEATEVLPCTEVAKINLRASRWKT